MFEQYLAAMAVATGLLSVSTVISASLSIQFSIFGTLPSLANCKSRWQRITAMHMIGTFWAAYYVYHYLIAKLFTDSVILNLVNLVTVILTSAGFCRAMYYLANGLPWRSKDYNKDLLVQTGDHWEVILAGVVLIHIALQQSGL